MPSLVNCGTCGYPHPDDGVGCPNPACFANPDMPESTKVRVRAEMVKHAEEKTEREKMHRVRAWAAGR